MAYQTTCNYKEEILPWQSYIPKQAKHLIIGTFPTEPRKRKYNFFYPNTNNCFWEVLFAITNSQPTCFEGDNAVLERKKQLDSLSLGITDMGEKVLRHGNSSLDSGIFPVKFMDVFHILDTHPTINKLIFTSSSGQNSVEGWFRSYCKLNDMSFPKLKGKNPKKFQFLGYSRPLEIVSVHSTSGAAGRSFKELVDMYNQEITK